MILIRMLVILYLGLMILLCHGALAKSFERYAIYKGWDDLYVHIVQAALALLGCSVFIFLITDYLAAR